MATCNAIRNTVGGNFCRIQIGPLGSILQTARVRTFRTMFATIAPSESERYLSPGAGEQPEGREEPARVGTMPGHPTGHSIEYAPPL